MSNGNFDHLLDRFRQRLDSIREIDQTIEKLCQKGIITGQGSCDHGKFELLSREVDRHFQIPRTNFTSSMERLLYAISANQQPANILCIGIFCGNTLIWNIGAGCGPGKCYEPERLIGVEIRPKYARMACDNLDRLGVLERVEILAEDGHDVIDGIHHSIDLLYLDAFGPLPGTEKPNTKKIYLTLLQRAYDKIPKNGMVIAHDALLDMVSIHAADYLDFVRDKKNFRDSVCLAPDDIGIELSVK